MAGTGEDERTVSFSSLEEEVEYWKEKSMEYRAKCVDKYISSSVSYQHGVM